MALAYRPIRAYEIAYSIELRPPSKKAYLLTRDCKSITTSEIKSGSAFKGCCLKIIAVERTAQNVTAAQINTKRLSLIYFFLSKIHIS